MTKEEIQLRISVEDDIKRDFAELVEIEGYANPTAKLRKYVVDCVNEYRARKRKEEK